MIYAKARYLDPDTGRFLSQDAWEGDATNAPSLHKYLYAYQNPTVYTDPSGYCVWDLCIAETIGLVALTATLVDYQFGGQREAAYQEIKPESTLGAVGTEAYAFSQAAANTLTFGYHNSLKQGGTDGAIEHTKENILPINASKGAYNEFTSEDGDPVLGTLYGLKAVGQVASLGLAGEGVRVPYRAKSSSVRVSENQSKPGATLENKSNSEIPSQLRSDLEGGGSYLMKEKDFKKYAEPALRDGRPLGRPDGQFMTSSKEMNNVISETGGNSGALGKKFGVDDWDGEVLIRMDVENPNNFNPRLPDTSVSGANKNFLPGGKTSGGVSELITDPLPANMVWPTKIE